MEISPKSNLILGITCDPRAKTISIMSRDDDGKPRTHPFDIGLYGALVTGLYSIAPVVGQPTEGQSAEITGVNLLSAEDQTSVLQVQIERGPVLLFRLGTEIFARLRRIVLGQ